MGEGLATLPTVLDQPQLEMLHSYGAEEVSKNYSIIQAGTLE